MAEEHIYLYRDIEDPERLQLMVRDGVRTVAGTLEIHPIHDASIKQVVEAINNAQQAMHSMKDLTDG